MSLARNPHTPSAILAELARHPSRRVAAAALANAATPERVVREVLTSDPTAGEAGTSEASALFAGSLLRARPTMAGFLARHVNPAYRRIAARAALDGESIERLYSPAHRGTSGREAFSTNPLLARSSLRPSWYPSESSARDKASIVLTASGRLRGSASPALAARIGSASVDAGIADLAVRGRVTSESAVAVVRAWAARPESIEPDVLADVVSTGGVKAARLAASSFTLSRLRAASMRSRLLEGAWPLVEAEARAASVLEKGHIDEVWAAAHEARGTLGRNQQAWTVMCLMAGQWNGSARELLAFAHDAGA